MSFSPTLDLKLTFGNDSLPDTVILPHEKFTLNCHDDILATLNGNTSVSALGKRLTLVLTHLCAHGRTSVVKGVQGNNNHGWRRTPMGGNNGCHYYLWWAPDSAPPVKSISKASHSIFLRAIRHHDDHTFLQSGKINDYHQLHNTDLMSGLDFPLPWTPDQKSFINSFSAIRLLRGNPGSGKTASLWQTIQSRSNEQVLYLTWSAGLARQAEEYFESFTPNGTTVQVKIFSDFIREMAHGYMPKWTPNEAKSAFYNGIARLSPSILGRWHLLPDILYAEVRAHFVGEYLNTSENFNSKLALEDYTLRRLPFLGFTTEGIVAAISALETVTPIWDYFPDLDLARHALKKLISNRFLRTELSCLNRIVLDEVQDLTPIETSVPLFLARKIAEFNNGIAPFVLVSGDEGQTVRPTDFEWGKLKDLISQILKSPEDLSLSANLRNPSNIGHLVNSARSLYQHLPKEDRPRGLEENPVSDATNGKIIYCRESNGPSLSRLLKVLADLPGCAIIRVHDNAPTFFAEDIKKNILSVAESKGLEFQTVCVLEPASLLAPIMEIKEDLKGAEINRLRKRLAIDQIRVAISRPTETLIFLDLDPTENQLQSFNTLLAESQVFRMNAEELLDFLDTEDTGPEIYIQQCIQDVRNLIEVKPLNALHRCQQAVALLGNPDLPNGIADFSLRNEVHLLLARIHLQLLVNRDGSNLNDAELLSLAHVAAQNAQRPDIATVLNSLLSYREEQLILKKAKLLPGLIELIKTKGNCDPWVQIGLRFFYPEFRQQLELFAQEPQYCHELCQNIVAYYEVLEIPIEEAKKAVMKIRTLAVETLNNTGLHQNALTLAKLIDPEPKELILRCQNALNKPSPSLIPASNPEKPKLEGIPKTQVIDLGNGVTLDLSLIPSGSFLMGSPLSEKNRFVNETLHKVTITKSFYLGSITITQEQWELLMGNNPSYLKNPKFPVTDVSWNDCHRFIDKLNALTSGGFRLPTEAEWEYACRAGTTTATYFGETMSTENANVRITAPLNPLPGQNAKPKVAFGEVDTVNFSSGINYHRPQPVLKPTGLYPPNSFGLYDMHGNIWEWCKDWYEPYSKEDSVDPGGPKSGKKRICRGGSYIDEETCLRAAFRGMESPNNSNRLLGFRIARSI
ncbi:MAG: hypothetical protein EBT92_18010 [Planctomycetes bacterium]|nr:hypothetical protein [Planctomycetota bacterium]